VTRNILTSHNFRFLVPSISSPSEELAIEPEMDDPPREGEPERDTWSVNPVGRAPENDHIDVDAPRKTRGVQVDYRYLNDPFLDEEEAGVSIVREESYAAVPNNECCSLREAKQSPEWPEWEKAICAKLDQLKKMGTWRLVDKPSGVVAIANKFIFAKKRDKDGRLVKYKARLVAKGCAQRLGYDYIETHLPVVRMETIRAILAIAPMRKLFIQQLDVKGAYLNGKLKERMYMRQPEGHDDGTGRICLLIKMLYGLKQAG